MFAKIFVLAVIAINPQGEVMTMQPGQYQTQEACELAQKDYRVRMQVAKVPGDRVMLLCVGTPWDVPGQRGA